VWKLVVTFQRRISSSLIAKAQARYAVASSTFKGEEASVVLYETMLGVD
jgi:hypothetical protein